MTSWLFNGFLFRGYIDMKNVLVGILLTNIVTFLFIPLILMYTNQYAYVDFMIFLESPVMQLLVFAVILGLSIYALKTMDTQLPNWKRTLLSIMAMGSIVVILIQLFWIFVLS